MKVFARESICGAAGWILAVLALGGFAPSASASAITEAYAFTDAGESSCGTSGPTPEMRAAITGGGYAGAGTPGPGCGIVYDDDFMSSLGGAATAASTGSASFDTSFGAGSTAGDAHSSSSFNSLGVFSEMSYTGASDGYSYGGSESFGLLTDGFVIGNTNAATMQVNYHLSGFQTATNRGDANLYVMYQRTGGSQLLAFKAADDPSGVLGANVYVGGVGYVSSGNGINIGTNTISVNTNLSFSIPVSYNSNFDLTILMYGSSLPRACYGCTSTAVDDFASTLAITGFNLFDGQGNLIQNPIITRDSSAIPEPATLTLIVAALAVLALKARSRQSHL